MKELYNGEINEFVRWTDGYNYLTKGNDTEGKPVSGGSIRNLLQTRLQNPITIYRDKTSKLYRVFSSEDSKNLWESNPSKYADLELANFAAPSEYSISLGIPNNETIRYIREGVPNQAGSKISYSWSVSDDKGNEQDENIYVTYTIVETGEIIPKTYTPANKNVTIDLFEYLVPGKNTVRISARGSITGATGEKEVEIHTVTLNIRTDLKSYNVLTLGNPLQFGMYAERNITGPLNFSAKRYYCGAGVFNGGASESVENDIPIAIVDQNNLTPNASYYETGNPQLQAGLHVIQVVARIDIENQAFYSNMLYYVLGVNKSISDQMSDDRITFTYEYNDTHDFTSDTGFILPLTQYEEYKLNWSYIRLGTDNKSKTISWYLRRENSQDSSDYTEQYLNEFFTSSNQEAPQLTVYPTSASVLGYNDYLVAKTNTSELIRIPIYINQSSLQINETGGLDLRLKLSAFGKSNENSSKDQWQYTYNGNIYSTTFTGFSWNEASGWYNNSLRLVGRNTQAIINHNPFGSLNMAEKGVTVEIEFESEYVSDNNDELITLGGIGSSSTRVVIKANKATLYVKGAKLIETNYKTNERVKLAFIVEPSGNTVSEELRKVAFIVNNGICERAAGWKDLDGAIFSEASGNITIGGCNSGIRVYSIRCYSAALTILNAYNNYVYDSSNKAKIIYNNDLYLNGVIDMDKCKERLDIIRIEGDLTDILTRGTLKDDSNTTCTIERICTKDPSKNFKVVNGRIRKHGQSTLTYPLTSYKIWLNNSGNDNLIPVLTIDEDSNLPFVKNRYQMKDDSIPANKFVLQANYADSSGVHNGGLLRLIQDTWYNAVFPDGEYKLRTAPQLFMSNKTISRQIGDRTTVDSVADKIFRGYNEEGKQWKDYFGEVKCPYIVRNAPDSFPCLVFYRNTGAGDITDTLLGQYVFMDDKKSDFTYGQRSIYYVTNPSTGANNANDPFCVKRNPTTGEALWDEESTNARKIWNNDNVLRIEVLSVNSTLADYRGYIADNSKRRFDDFISGNTENDTSIGWEEDFELVYPDKEDITEGKKSNKRFSPTKFHTIIQPFTDWLQWIIDTKNNYQEMGYESAQEAFEDTAASHLDLYKMAAYYIFVLRFGLVDSLERNAQIKTYDGVHFHYEPWDMDIALGNRNTGGIAFDPPITRRTMMDENTAAISGYAKIDTDGDEIEDTWVSNWLFDALEAWSYFMNTIVKQTADALYDAGLTYANAINEFDKNYQDAWPERIYNHSGNFKYVVNRQNTDEYGNITEGYNDTWLDWLQGARTTHRHWWLKSSMDFYDAKWGVGEFTKRRIYLACEMHNRQGSINIKPISDTYFSFTREADTYGPFEATALNGLQFSVADINSGAKVPFYINGANFVKELDISIVASGLQTLQVDNAYSSEVGPIITKINAGVRFTTEEANRLVGQRNGKNLNIIPGRALDALEELNIRGQNGRVSASFLQEIRTIKKLYAAGAGLISLSSAAGTNYELLELPDSLTSISFNSTTWDPANLSFWTTTPGGEQEVTYYYDEPILDEETGQYITEETVVEYLQSEYNKYVLPNVSATASLVQVPIPRTLNSVTFTGTTGKNACSRQFLKDWMYSIIDQATDEWTNSSNSYYAEAHAEDLEGNPLYSTLDEYIKHLFNTKTLSIENIYWDNETIAGLSYQELTYLAMFNNIDYEHINTAYESHPNIENFRKGYIVSTDPVLTGIQTSQLSTWFGEGVFTLNSGGLVIDNASNITAIVVGPSARTVNGEIYLKEGESARLSATRFKLQPSNSQQVFTFRDQNSTSIGTTYTYPSNAVDATCVITESQSDGDYYYYLNTYPNTSGQSYDVIIGSGNATQVVHIEPLEYPQAMQLGIEINDKMQDNQGGYEQNPKGQNNVLGSVKYYKTPNYYIASAGATIILGVQFKHNNKYFYDIQNKDLKDNNGNIQGYVKFKVYKDGVLTAPFETAKNYTEFMEDNTRTANNIDGSYFQYYTGYNRASTAYKYFIPLTVGMNPPTPVKYTISAELKIGGLVQTITQDIIVASQDIIAEEGTILWGIIDSGYYDMFHEHFDGGNFTKGIGLLVEGTIGTDGVYYSGVTEVSVASNIGSLTSLIYNGQSILLSLPNITGIKLNGASNLTSTTTISGVDKVNIDLTNISKLTYFNIENCTSLTQDIDLSENSNIEQVDASGTFINIILPTNPKITRIEYGTPTEINIINPTVLNADNIIVDSYATLDSLELVNIPNTKTFTAFGNIFDMFILGGTVIYYRVLSTDSGHEGEEVYSGNDYDWVSSYIPVAKGANITINRSPAVSGGYNIFEYNNTKEYITRTYLWKSNTAPVLQLNSETKYIRFKVDRNTVYNIVDNTTGDVYFSYNPN